MELTICDFTATSITLSLVCGINSHNKEATFYLQNNQDMEQQNVIIECNNNTTINNLTQETEYSIISDQYFCSFTILQPRKNAIIIGVIIVAIIVLLIVPIVTILIIGIWKIRRKKSRSSESANGSLGNQDEKETNFN